MTFTDILTYPLKPFQCSSMNDKLNKKDQHRTLKRINSSMLNLFPRNQQSNQLTRSNTTEQLQKQDSFLYPPSDLSRSISNKSITFALVFDQEENENNHLSEDMNQPEENNDLVIVVPNKYVNNQSDVNKSSTSFEPYPFRSEIPSCSLTKSNSSHSKKKSLHQLFSYHRPKKFRHPVTLAATNRSNSAPLILCSTINNQQRPAKPFHRWFKLPSMTRFLTTFISHPKETTTHLKQKSHLKSITLRKYSEMIY